MAEIIKLAVGGTAAGGAPAEVALSPVSLPPPDLSRFRSGPPEQP
jgi:hypothetical protein